MAQDNLQSQSEQEIQFKKRARRRLVGAIALVLLMIVLLPMLLQDKSSQAPREDVVISIPSQDAQLEVKESAEPAKPVEVVQPLEAKAPEANPAVLSDSKMPEPLAPVVDNKPAPVAQEAQPSNKEEVKPQAAAPTQKAVVKDKTDTTAPTGNYFVQIGVFSDASKVKLMQAKLTEKGLKSRVDLIDTAKGQKTRLRVGLFATRLDAEDALTKVKSLGLTDAVIGN